MNSDDHISIGSVHILLSQNLCLAAGGHHQEELALKGNEGLLSLTLLHLFHQDDGYRIDLEDLNLDTASASSSSFLRTWKVQQIGMPMLCSPTKSTLSRYLVGTSACP